MKKLKVPALLLALLGLCVCSSTAIAAPILGQQVYYEGGDVYVTVLPYEAAYTSQLILLSTPTPVVIATNSDVGTVVDLGDLALYGINPGDEVIFGIRVLNTGNLFEMGPGSRNPDGIEHVTVDYGEELYGDTALLGFEDLFGGGDRDYNDAMFRIEGGIGVAQVPAPSSLILLTLGLAGVAAASRRLFKGSRPIK